jgi:quercetin dioxygenase-like cupin family protein
MTRIVALSLALLTIASDAPAQTAAPAAAQPQVGTRQDLQRHDLSMTGREVVQTIVSLAPGAVAPRHSHPGEEIIYVLKGTWVYQLDGQPPKTLKAGDVLFVPHGVVHAARNIGTETGSELATYIVEKGKPLLVLEK